MGGPAGLAPISDGACTEKHLWSADKLVVNESLGTAPFNCDMTFGKKPARARVGVERRRLPRKPADLPAQIVLPNGQTFACRVLNHAQGTARLSLTSVLGVPAKFELHAGGAVYEAQTIRRGVGTLVVCFK
jgi:hypothetical protein